MEKKIEQAIRAAMYEKLAAGTAAAMEPIVQAAAHAIVKKMRKDWGTEVSCAVRECLYNDSGKCVQDDIDLNAYQLCESVDMG